MPFDPDQPRDEFGRWTDAGGAIRAAASDRPIGIAFSTYRSTGITNIDQQGRNIDQQDADIRSSPEYQTQQEMVKEAAAGLGIEILDKLDTWGGYVDSETGVPVQEVSNVIHVNASPERAELLAAILGKAAPEEQDSVLVGTHNPDGEGIEYTIKTGSFSNAKKAIDSMKENGIQYFTINKNNGDIILIDTDNSIPENVSNFIGTLKERGLYENFEFSRTDAKFVSHESYDGIIEKGRGQARSEKGFDINAFVESTKKRYPKAREKIINQPSVSSLP